MTINLPETYHRESIKLFDVIINEDKALAYLDILKKHHAQTYEHSLRVCLICIDLGLDNNIKCNDLKTLGYGGLLHDVEKANISTDLLSKKAELNNAERSLIEEHPRLGFFKLENFEDEIVKEIVVAHHEFQKNNPYPRNGVDNRNEHRSTPDRRKNCDKITLFAQIVAITDMFDALTTERAYKEAFSISEADKILRYQFTGDSLYIDQLINKYQFSSYLLEN